MDGRKSLLLLFPDRNEDLLLKRLQTSTTRLPKVLIVAGEKSRSVRLPRQLLVSTPYEVHSSPVHWRSQFYIEQMVVYLLFSSRA
jgi:hypothetical protein